VFVVVVHGSVWSEANEFAKQIASQPKTTLIHPFDDPEVSLFL
jgi:threonine dehydratase